MKKILEIGCGEGYNSYILSKKNTEIIGVDLSKKNIEIAKNRYRNVNFQVMNVEDLKFKDNFFEEIYALDILEHVDNLKKVLIECERVLRKNGKFIINVPAEKSEQWLLKIRPTYFKEIHHVRIFKNSKNELEGLLQNFKLIKKTPMGFLQHIELYWLFTRKNKSETQLGIGTWRDSKVSMFIHLSLLFFDPVVLKTPLKWIPIWILTLPIGFIINSIGNRFFPKSFYYEFKKNI